MDILKRNKQIFFSVFFLLSLSASAQNAIAKYWIYFADRSNSPYSLSNPTTYLSQAAIDRRAKMNITIKSSDLPPNPEYINAITATGAKVIVTSKWLNAVSVEITNEDQLAAISLLPFVIKINTVAKYANIDDSGIPINNTQFYRIAAIENNDYGGAFNQNNMIDIDFLHSLGYTGQGITIAVLDGGFYGVDIGVGFESVRNKNQIIETRNFPDENDQVYFASTHGSNVLSIMAVDMPGTYIGSAPDANYYLFRTEIVDSEYVVEEDHWLAAAEYADFVGADIINSSLGYTTFDDATQDHTYADMDGNTTVATIAADHAAAAGILVVNSAGNSGDDDWNFIGAPADGDSVFTIGAVDLNGYYVSFSSEGPSSDGRLKPNVVGQGAGTAVMDQSGVVYYGNGTSYSSPLIAGACASFMSAFPELSNMEVIDILQRTASRADNPNNQYGYGIPNFAKAYLELKDITLSTSNIISIIPNPVETEFTAYIHATETGNATVSIYNMSGQSLYAQEVAIYDGKIAPIYFNNFNNLASGVYAIQLVGDVYTETKLFVVK